MSKTMSKKFLSKNKTNYPKSEIVILLSQFLLKLNKWKKNVVYEAIATH